MESDRKKSRICAIIMHFIKSDMLPFDEIDYYDSEWYEWLNRINAGFESEKRRLEKLADGASEEYAEVLAEDYQQAENISGNMYAALIVSVWSKIECFLSNLSCYCKYFGLPSIKGKPDIKCYADYFGNLGINLQSVKNNQFANIFRVLSNAFKHNDSYYIPDSFPIDKKLAKRYGISEYYPHTNCRIKYIDLPIKKMIIAAGVFCNNLFNETETILKQKAKDE